jgi:predicted RNase H-like HicB family nuclease
MKFIITVEQDENGMFIAECPNIPGRISQGKTEQEALANIKDAIKQCLEVRAEKRMPLTVATHGRFFTSLLRTKRAMLGLN